MFNNTYDNHDSETIVVVVHKDDDDDDVVIVPDDSKSSPKSRSGSGLIATLFALIITALFALAVF
jgi:hypothetical protein